MASEGIRGSFETLAQQLAVTGQLVRQSTVHVRNRGPGAGSGVIWRSDGLIVTNAHVAHGSHAVIETWDGQTFEAEVAARDARRDLAALTTSASALPGATVADSDALRVGQLVVAVGNPLGLSGALTTGVIHAIAPTRGQGHQAWVQADIHLAPGNSGGPLADVEGRVLGINSMVSGGLGLAVPSNAVKRFLGEPGGQLRLGLTMQPVVVSTGARRQSLPALLILEAAPGSPAAEAGLGLGDILVGVDEQRFEDARDLLQALQEVSASADVRLDILRGGKPIQIVVSGLESTDKNKRAPGVGEAA